MEFIYSKLVLFFAKIFEIKFIHIPGEKNGRLKYTKAHAIA